MRNPFVLSTIDPAPTTTPSSLKAVRARSNAQHRSSIPWRLLRSVLFEAPFLVTLLLYATIILLQDCDRDYFTPQKELLNFLDKPSRQRDEVTYYGRRCTVEDSTASSPEEIMITDDMSTDDAVDSMLKHGISIFPNLLQEETARKLRDSIVEHNPKVWNFRVIANENRYSYGIKVEQHPVVRQAVQEITTNPVLKPALAKVIGDNPAVYKFHAITSSYGAEDQYFHWDVSAHKSSSMYARTFAPIYSLFIPLQNTTADMGATDICPGSHICGGRSTPAFCHKKAFRASGERDNWQAGYGALMNQQTTHRGRAHVMEGGPDRVLFILAFTPRTHFEHISRLQTRSLSLGGSYAIHWTQWGHTTYDMEDPWRRMLNPWKFLRALGLYKPKDAYWGWDWISTVLVQLVNSQYYSRNSLEEYVEAEGSPYRFLPRFLHGVVDEEIRDKQAWYLFVMDTLHRCEDFLYRVAVYCLSIYLSVLVAYNTYLFRRHKKPRNGRLVWCMVRVLVLQAIAYGFYYSTTQRIASTPWARHIRTNRLYQLPQRHRNPELPSVLPTNHDVMSMEDYQSDYLASYARIYDVTHPGLIAWNAMISRYSNGYSNMPGSLQRLLCSTLVQWALEEKRRLLTKNHVNQWSRMPDDVAIEFTHQKLKRRESSKLDEALRQLDFLMSETKFGTWRDTPLHWTHIPAMLKRLQRKLLRYPMIPTTAIPRFTKRGTSTPLRMRRSKLMDVPNRETMANRNSLPPPPSIEEPFLGAWLKVGDEIEGRYKSEFNEWYRGTITAAVAHSTRWDVEYVDGDSNEGICQYCIRPFEEYQIGEVIEYKPDPEEKVWVLARITAIHGDDRYDFRHLFDQLERHSSNVETVNIRRFKLESLDQVDDEYSLGEEIEAMYYGDEENPIEEGEWRLGRVVDMNDNKTFAVHFFSGKFSDGLSLQQVRKLS